MCTLSLMCEGVSHVGLSAIKWIIRYLKSTVNVSIWCPKTKSFKFVGYVDSNYASCMLDCKSTSKGCQFLRSSLVSWCSRKQHYVALSSTKVEYVAIEECVSQLLWMMHTLIDYRLKYMNEKVRCNNISTINLIKN